MAIESITLRVNLAWWVRPYISVCILFAKLFSITPDVEKIAQNISEHGVRVGPDCA